MCKITGEGVIHKLVEETLKDKPGFASKEQTFVYIERVNNSLISVPVMVVSDNKGFRLTAMVYQNVPENCRKECGEYLDRLNTLLWDEGKTGYFALDNVGNLTFRVVWSSPGVVNSRAVMAVVDDAGHQLCRFGNLLLAAAHGEDAADLARRSVACLSL